MQNVLGTCSLAHTVSQGSGALALPRLLLAPPCDHSCPPTTVGCGTGLGSGKGQEERLITTQAGPTWGWQHPGVPCEQLARVCISAGKSLTYSFLIQWPMCLSGHRGIKILRGFPVFCKLGHRSLGSEYSWLNFPDPAPGHCTEGSSGSWREVEPPCMAGHGPGYWEDLHLPLE